MTKLLKKIVFEVCDRGNIKFAICERRNTNVLPGMVLFPKLYITFFTFDL